MSNAPLYLQIKQFIDDKISMGHWPPGHRITTELELTKQFNVSRMTVNKAIRDLVSEGKLARKPRLGTFVCEPTEKAQSPLLDINNIAQEIRERGQNHRSQVVKHLQINADEKTAMQLGVMINTPIFYSEIIHFSDNTPTQLECRWVNSDIVPGYLDQDFTHATPNEYLSNNCPLSAIEHTVEAIVPEHKVQESLEMAANEPCLLLNRRTWSAERLVSFALLYHPGSKYKLSSKILLD